MTMFQIIGAGEPLSRDWTRSERNDIFHAAYILSQLYGEIDIEWGLTDQGDPWACLVDCADGQVVGHFARFDGAVIADFPLLSLTYTGRTIAEVLRRVSAADAIDLTAQSAPERLAQHFRRFSNTTMGLIAALIATAIKPLQARAARNSAAQDRQPTINAEGSQGAPPAKATWLSSALDKLVPELAIALASMMFFAVSAQKQALAAAAETVEGGADVPDFELPAPGAEGAVAASAAPVPGGRDDTTAPTAAKTLGETPQESAARAPDALAPATEPVTEADAPVTQTQTTATSTEPGRAPAMSPAPGPGAPQVAPGTVVEAAPNLDTMTPTSDPVDAALPIAAPNSPASSNQTTGAAPANDVDILARPDGQQGSDGDDSLQGGAGNDAIAGGDGDDVIDGGSGDDSLSGDAGNDTLLGGLGEDWLSGGPGNDVLLGQVGDDSLYGGVGDDTLHGGAGDDALFGGEGHDTLTGDGGDDLLDGGSGDDSLAGGEGDDTLLGMRGDDSLHGERGDDTLYGGEGDDALKGGPGDDILLGETGDDSLVGGSGNDIAIGGEGKDHLRGKTGNDLLQGGAGDDDLHDKRGLDTLFGGAGDDDLFAGTQGLLYDGGDETPTIFSFSRTPFSRGDTLVFKTTAIVDLGSGVVDAEGTLSGPEIFSIENISGSHRDDRFSGNADDNDIRTGSGNDVVTLGQGGNDLITDFTIAAARDDESDTLLLPWDDGTVALSSEGDFLAFVRLLASDDDPATEAIIYDNHLALVLGADEAGVPTDSVLLRKTVRHKEDRGKGIWDDDLVVHGAVERGVESSAFDSNDFRDWADNDYDLDANIVQHHGGLALAEGTVRFRIDGQDLADAEDALFSKDAKGAGDGDTALVVTRDGQLALRVEGASGPQEIVSDSGAVERGGSHDIAFSFGEDGVALYVDGSEVASADIDLDWLSNDEDILLGASSGHIKSGRKGMVDDHFEGEIGGLEIVDWQMTPDELRARSVEDLI
ncbi:MAG: LamG-like jellyroll fold domain-containing protein [Pseudomonadota bacterium]